MPNPIQPMNEEELKEKIANLLTGGVHYYEISDSFMNDGAMSPQFPARYSGDVVNEVDKITDFILIDRNAAIREARIEEHNRLEEYISTPFDRRVSYRNTPNLAFDDGANDVKYWIRKWSKTRVEQLQSQPNTKEEE